MTDKKKSHLIESDDPSTDKVYAADCGKMSDVDLVEWFLFDATDLVFSVLKEINDISHNRHKSTEFYRAAWSDIWRMEIQRAEMRKRGKLKGVPRSFDNERADMEGLENLSERDLYFNYFFAIDFLRHRYDLHYFRDAEHEREWYAKSSAAWKRIEEIHGELERRRENA